MQRWTFHNFVIIIKSNNVSSILKRESKFKETGTVVSKEEQVQITIKDTRDYYQCMQK